MFGFGKRATRQPYSNGVSWSRLDIPSVHLGSVKVVETGNPSFAGSEKFRGVAPAYKNSRIGQSRYQ